LALTQLAEQDPLINLRQDDIRQELHVLLYGESAMARLRAAVQTQEMRGSSCTVVGGIPAARVHELQQQLPALTCGEGVMECEFDSYRAVRGKIPTRPRTDYNPLNRKEYLLRVMRRV
jgi:ribosomal protection tetracycline resistance protein